MTSDEYNRWARDYALRFGFRERADLEMLASWYEILGCEEPDDLYEASRRLALAEYPSFPRDHLKALLPLCRLLRAERASRATGADPGGDRGTCATCGGTGRVTVPHPRCVVNGQWEPGGSLGQYYTAAVTCTCALGEWFHDNGTAGAGKDTRRMLTLAQYERTVCPNWRGEMRVREMRAAAEVRATADVPSRVDNAEALTAALRRLAERFAAEGSVR